MKKLGIMIFVIGLAFTLMTGFKYVTREKVVDIGEVEIMANKNHSITWSPIIGIVAMAAGAGLYLLGNKKSLSI